MPATRWFWSAEDYDVGISPPEWEIIKNFSSILIEEDGSGKFLRLNGQSGRSFADFIPAGVSTDVEVYAKVVMSADGWAHVRGSNLPVNGNETSYRIDRNTSGNRISRYLNGSFSTITSVGSLGGGNDIVNMRFRAVGSQLQGKWWLEGTAEPETWTAELTDTLVTTPGTVGVGHWSGTNFRLYEFGVGIDGDEAPTEPVSEPEIIDEDVSKLYSLTVSSERSLTSAIQKEFSNTQSISAEYNFSLLSTNNFNSSFDITSSVFSVINEEVSINTSLDTSTTSSIISQDSGSVYINVSPTDVGRIQINYTSWSNTEIVLDEISKAGLTGSEFYFKIVRADNQESNWFGPVPIADELENIVNENILFIISETQSIQEDVDSPGSFEETILFTAIHSDSFIENLSAENSIEFNTNYQDLVEETVDSPGNFEENVTFSTIFEKDRTVVLISPKFVEFNPIYGDTNQVEFIPNPVQTFDVSVSIGTILGQQHDLVQNLNVNRNFTIRQRDFREAAGSLRPLHVKCKKIVIGIAA